jgi:NADH-quinone oxidoreductase subunit M
MAELGFPWVCLMLLTGGLMIGVASLRLRPETLRFAMVLAELGMLALAAGPIGEVGGLEGLYQDPWAAWIPAEILVVDELAALLLPFGCLLWAAGLCLAPRVAFSPQALRRVLAAQLGVLGIFVTREPWALAVLWTASIASLVLGLDPKTHARARAVAAWYLGVSAACFVAGAALIEAAPAGASAAEVGVLLVSFAVMVRTAIIPVHSWLAELFEGGRLGTGVLFITPQIAAYVIAVLLVPRAAGWELELIGGLALTTAVYAAAATLVQTDPRRAYAYLLMSQSALVVAGLESTTVVGLTGGLCLWLSSGVAMAGFGFTLWMLEARHGRLSLIRLQGGYEARPLLASSFLVFGLASVGFPGTLGFVSDELLMSGAVSQFPTLGFAVVVAVALNGITVMRMFLRLFCGPSEGIPSVRLRRRELAAAVGLVAVLLLFGFFPGPVVESRTRTARALEAARPTTTSVSGQPASGRRASVHADRLRIARSWLDRGPRATLWAARTGASVYQPPGDPSGGSGCRARRP